MWWDHGNLPDIYMHDRGFNGRLLIVFQLVRALSCVVRRRFRRSQRSQSRTRGDVDTRKRPGLPAKNRPKLKSQVRALGSTGLIEEARKMLSPAAHATRSRDVAARP